MKLNPQQKKAIACISRPCLVLAGAGSGKTRVITQKIVHLIRECDYKSQHIYALTFTNKAAREMKQRISHMLDRHEVRGLQVCTFHTFGLHFIRREHHQFALKPNFTLFDDQDQINLIKALSTNTQPLDKNECMRILQQISTWKSKLCSPEAALRQENQGQAVKDAQYYQLYQRHLRAYNAVDFDDLITLPCQLLQTNEKIRYQWQRRVSYLLVDEYQDTNMSQYELIKQLVGGRGRLTVVGDDDQSIYAWRGAHPENLNQLKQDFEQLTVIKLEQNYRSKQRILRCANQLIAHNPHLFSKQLFSTLDEGEKIRVLPAKNESAEADLVVNEILTHQFHHRTDYHDYAILYRSNYQARELEKTLTENRIPYQISGGTSFFNRTEIKDIMAYLRLLVNLDDDSAFLRVVNTPKREIGPSTLEKLGNYAKSRKKSLFEASFEIGLQQHLQGRGLHHLRAFTQWFSHLEDRFKREAPETLLSEMLDEINYAHWLKEQAPSPSVAEQRLKNISTLLGWIKTMLQGDALEPGVSFTEAVSRLTLREVLERNETNETNKEVQLMTLHAAKGLEFPYVFIIGFEDGILPHQNSLDNDMLEEERRLAYVGMTRAQRQLTLTYCRERRAGGETITSNPSCFLNELPTADILWQHNKPKVTPEERMQTGKASLANLRAMLADK